MLETATEHRMKHVDKISYPKVSVIVPLYNVAEFVKETIGRLQRQTLTDLEFILVDDGSTDNTYEIASEFAESDPRIRLISQENQGPSAARNHGLRLVNGDYICFVDADDLMSYDALELMYDAALEHDADLVMGGTIRFNSRRTWNIKTYIDFGILEPGLKHITTHPGLMYAVGPCAKLYKRELVAGVFFPEHIRLGEDQPFALYAYVHANKIYTVDSTVYFYRQREGETESLTQQAISRPLDIFNDLYEMIELARDVLKEDWLFHFYLERVIAADIWPRVKAAVMTLEGSIQAAAMNSLATWLESVDTKTFNQVSGLYYFPLAGLIWRLRYLKGPAFSPLFRLIKVILKKMRPTAYGHLLGVVSYKLLRRFWSIVKRQNRRFKRVAERFVLKKVVFAIAKRLPVQRKVVFATNKTEELVGNLQFLHVATIKYFSTWGTHVYSKQLNPSFISRVRQYYTMGRAAVMFLDDYYHQLYGLRGRENGDIIQVWHAAGAFKKFGLSSLGAIDANSYDFEVTAHGSYTKVLASSSAIRDFYSEAFNVPVRDVLPLGVPRTDMFFDGAHIAEVKSMFVNEYPQLQGKKILLYAPTFRGTPRERVQFQIQLDLDMMAKSLGDDYVLLLKLHPAVKQGVQIPNHLNEFVLDLSASADINDLMLISDILITDYSSVVFEYSLLQRPMIFFAYDLEDYLNERGFYYDYTSFVPGPIVKETAEMIRLIQQGNFDMEKVNTFADKFFDFRDGKATERILTHFLK